MSDILASIEQDAETILNALDETPEKLALQLIPRSIEDPVYRGGVALVAWAEQGKNELATLGVTSGPLVDQFNQVINGLGPKLVPPAGSAVLEYFINTYFPQLTQYALTNSAPATAAGKAVAIYNDPDVAAAQAALTAAQTAARAKVLAASAPTDDSGGFTQNAPGQP